MERYTPRNLRTSIVACGCFLAIILKKVITVHTTIVQFHVTVTDDDIVMCALPGETYIEP